jgi:predicted RNA-binding Zn-ribbon protein involved in translation (DUF1610 family)
MNEVGNHNGRVCPICSNGYATLTNHATRDASKVDCPQCGNFIISRSAIINLGNGAGEHSSFFASSSGSDVAGDSR